MYTRKEIGRPLNFFHRFLKSYRFTESARTLRMRLFIVPGVTMSALPVFRADVVGSLLRTEELKQARKQAAEKTLSAEALRRIEDKAVEHCVQCQKAAGFSVLTDGEQRRAWWHFDFFEGVEGIEGYDAEGGIQFSGVQTKARNVRVVGKLKFGNHPFLKDFETLQKIAGDATAKITIPSPSVLHFRGGRSVVSRDV